jgi:hypothetical protein
LHYPFHEKSYAKSYTKSYEKSYAKSYTKSYANTDCVSFSNTNERAHGFSHKDANFKPYEKSNCISNKRLYADPTRSV